LVCTSSLSGLEPLLLVHAHVSMAGTTMAQPWRANMSATGLYPFFLLL
jgi:hypothetical protein